MSITKNVLVNWYSLMKKKLRKIRMIFEIENFVSPAWKLHNPYCHSASSNYTRYELSWIFFVISWTLEHLGFLITVSQNLKHIFIEEKSRKNMIHETRGGQTFKKLRACVGCCNYRRQQSKESQVVKMYFYPIICHWRRIMGIKRSVGK